MSKDPIVVVGAGIGGLTLALALKAFGIDDVLVLEQASVLREVGAGVQITPNAVRVLHRLGLEERLRKVSINPRATLFRSWDSGVVVREIPLGNCLARYGVPYYQIHRAHLHAALADVLGLEHVRLGVKCVDIAQLADGALVTLDSGDTLKGRIVVGADGIHSTIRSVLFGAEEPLFSGTVAWRGLTPVSKLAGLDLEKVATAWWGPTRHFVTYYVAAGELMNWVGVIRSGSSLRKESWSLEGDLAEAMGEYSGWHPIVEAIIRNSNQPFKWALYDREPRASWTQGNVTLLGDAAHPMLPMIGQGAGMSIEDAYVLARCIERYAAAPESALNEYERIRIPRTREMQLRGRANGQTFHLASPLARLVRDVKHRAISISDSLRKKQAIDWIYGYDCIADVERRFAAA